MKSFWSKLTPAERSLEMRRRIQVARDKREQRLTDTPKRSMSKAGRDAIREAQRRRWREAKRAGRGKDFSMDQSRKSPFPVEKLRAIAAAHDTPGSIRERLEAIESAVAQLKADIGLE